MNLCSENESIDPEVYFNYLRRVSILFSLPPRCVVGSILYYISSGIRSFILIYSSPPPNIFSSSFRAFNSPIGRNKNCLHQFSIIYQKF